MRTFHTWLGRDGAHTNTEEDAISPEGAAVERLWRLVDEDPDKPIGAATIYVLDYATANVTKYRFRYKPFVDSCFKHGGTKPSCNHTHGVIRESLRAK